MATRHAAPPSHHTPPWGWALAGALLGLVWAGTVFAPARWLAVSVQQASNQRVQLTQLQGSVWQGSAQLVLSGGEGSSDAVALPGRVYWHIQPRWLGLEIALGADCCTQEPLRIELLATGWKALQVALHDAHSQWPASLLTGLGTPWNTVRAQGKLVASSQGFGAQWSADKFMLAGQLQVDALQVSSRLSTLSPMGSYRIVLQGGTAPSLQLSTLEGSLQLSGNGYWLGSRLRFKGVASAVPDRVEALTNLLNILGRRDGARSIITIGPP